jgi:Holliday junction resolvase RusA-like endonuclease
MIRFDFRTVGTPVPKGSAKAFYNRHIGRAVVMQDNASKQKPWASAISYAAQEEKSKLGITGVTDLPVFIGMRFFFRRPKYHFGSGKNSGHIVRPAFANTYMTKKPDLDKLVRCVLDALTGVVWKDDSQVASLSASKRYLDEDDAEEGVDITLEF